MQHIDLLGSVGIAISVAAILAFIGNRLRQPLLLAYLLAGVLIGPQIGLGLVSDEASIENVKTRGSDSKMNAVPFPWCTSRSMTAARCIPSRCSTRIATATSLKGQKPSP